MKNYFLNLWSFIKEMYEEWTADSCFQHAAALSYYTVFSLAPMIVVVIAVAGYFFGREAVTGEMYHQIKGLIGPEGAKGIQTMVESAYRENQGLLPTIIGSATLLFSATVTFTALQDSLNKIWGIQSDSKKGILAVIINRTLSFAMVLTIGFLLMVSLSVDIVLSVLSHYIQRVLGEYSIYLMQAIQFAVSFSIITVLFAMIFKFLPDMKLRWRHVWKGAVLTAALFTLGKYLIGLYLGQSNLGSTYGAAASIVILLLWINYSCWIFFVGAQFIYVYARRRGEKIEASNYAIKINFRKKKEVVVPAESVQTEPQQEVSSR